MTDNATPRPWAVSCNPHSTRAQGIHSVAAGIRQNIVNWGGLSRIAGEGQANAYLIVRAVNAYDDLVAAAHGVSNLIQTWRETGRTTCLADLASAHDRLCAALAKAGAP